GESAEVVGQRVPCSVFRELLWSDEVGKAVVGLAGPFVHLLAQEMEGGQDLAAVFVGVKLDIVADWVGGEEPIDRASEEEVFADDFIQQLLRVLEEFLGFRSFQNRRIAPAQFPRVEEGGPVYQRN